MIGTYVKREARLPAAVNDLAIRLGANTQPSIGGVRLRQAGRMKTRFEAKSWLSFTATQTISTRECGFDWRARTCPFGMVKGCDALANGEARFDIVALGFIPIVRAEHSSALMRGELMRYLAELPWAPDAILQNAQLRWRENGPETLTVSAGAGETECEVVLSLDTQGRIVSGFAPDRPRSATAPFLPTAWRGHFSDYRLHDGRWLPFAGEVGWEIDGKENLYWQARIEHWETYFDER